MIWWLAINGLVYGVCAVAVSRSLWALAVAGVWTAVSFFGLITIAAQVDQEAALHKQGMALAEKELDQQAALGMGVGAVAPRSTSTGRRGFR